MNVVDQVPQPHQAVVVKVLTERAPELLSELRRKELPTYEEVDRVEDTMYAAVSQHYLPGHELDQEGLTIEDALVAFVGAFPNDILPDAPR
jgi:hypothetical protein